MILSTLKGVELLSMNITSLCQAMKHKFLERIPAPELNPDSTPIQTIAYPTF